jgi:predicted adenylyl cyclase CyaB
MALNLELKIKVVTFRKILKILNRIGAEYKAELRQKDVYFKSPKGLLKLRKQNGDYELIFYERDENSEERWSDYDVIKIASANAEKAFARFLDIEAVVEKTRRLYIYKNTRIHLDNVKGLGKFLELETVVDKGEKDALSRFEELATVLELDLSKQIKTSYRFLVEQ